MKPAIARARCIEPAPTPLTRYVKRDPVPGRTDRIERWVMEDAPTWVRIPIVIVYAVVGVALIIGGVVGFVWIFLVLFGGVGVD